MLQIITGLFSLAWMILSWFLYTKHMAPPTNPKWLPWFFASQMIIQPLFGAVFNSSGFNIYIIITVVLFAAIGYTAIYFAYRHWQEKLEIPALTSTPDAYKILIGNYWSLLLNTTGLSLLLGGLFLLTTTITESITSFEISTLLTCLSSVLGVAIGFHLLLYIFIYPPSLIGKAWVYGEKLTKDNTEQVDE